MGFYEESDHVTKRPGTGGAHVVVFPVPGAGGHHARFIPFIKILARNGLTVTVITTTRYLAKTRRALQLDDVMEKDDGHNNSNNSCSLPYSSREYYNNNNNNIRVIGIELPVEYQEHTADNFHSIVRAVAKHMRDPLRALMKQLMQSPAIYDSHNQLRPPVCIISDLFLAWTQDIADEFKLPRYCFYPTPHLASLLFSLPDFYAQGRLPHPPGDGSQPFMIPGFPPIPPSDLPPSLLLERTPNGLFEGERFLEAAGVLVNSAYELESGIIDGLQEMIRMKQLSQQRGGDQNGHAQGPKILPIGPLVYDQKIQFCSNQGAAGDADPFTIPLRERIRLQAIAADQENNNNNNNECLQWLSQRPKASVLYICLGSMSVFPIQQMGELASGLAASGVHFLWVVKVPLSPSSSASLSPLLPTSLSSSSSSEAYITTFLPEDFKERTKERGLIYTSWAPQLQILAHPAIGGFLTHCGWNSITESIAMGVPMIAWPLWADHMLNRLLCVDILDIALPVIIPPPNCDNNNVSSVEPNCDNGSQKEYQCCSTSSDPVPVVGREEIERLIRLLMEDSRGQVVKKKVEEINKIAEMATHAPWGSSWKNLLHFVEEVNSL